MISYASEDERDAAEVTDRLLSAGYGVWLDKYCLLAGQHWESEIRAAFAHVDALVFLISRHSTTKTGFVQKELRLALDAADERPDGRDFLIPLRVDDAAVPDKLARRHHLDMRDQSWFRRLQSSVDRCAADPAAELRGDRPTVEIMHVDFGGEADMLTIDYVLRSSGPAALLELGASLVGADGKDYFSVADDRRLRVSAGTAAYRRFLDLSSLPRPGEYRLVVSAWHESIARGTRLATGYGGEPLILS
jgi:hypothetical protein